MVVSEKGRSTSRHHHSVQVEEVELTDHDDILIRPSQPIQNSIDPMRRIRHDRNLVHIAVDEFGNLTPSFVEVRQLISTQEQVWERFNFVGKSSHGLYDRFGDGTVRS